MTEIPDAASRARQMYADGASIEDIIAGTGLTQAMLYRWLDGGGVLPALPRRYGGRARPRRKRGRAVMIDRIMRAADKQAREIGKRLADDGVPLTEREQQTRSLAVLAKTMRELIALETAEAEAQKLQTRTDDDSIPRDIDELVASLRAVLTRFSTLERQARDEVLKELLLPMRPREIESFSGDFGGFAHDYQLPPADAGWTTWLLLGGRGAGKTRAGAEWVRGVALDRGAAARIALIGETEHDAREVMVEGVSGLFAVHGAHEKPAWISSRRRLEWPNGAIAQVFSAEDPESLRGPQFSAAWCDELAKWRHADATFDMLQFGLRLGERPRQVITTTPRPISLLKRLLADPATVTTHATSRENAFNLSPVFFDNVIARYRGTRLGRQEIDGEIIEDRAGALWTRAGIEACRVTQAPPCSRIVVAVDPPASAKKGADACGLVAAGRAADGLIYVLADESVAGLTPQAWAMKTVALWRRLEADALVVEVNQGGDMVRAVIGEADRSVPVREVRAIRGKWLRAEPVAQLYEKGRVRHASTFPALEDEMCDFGLDGLSSGRSPDRLDALVWAVTALSFGAKAEPRVRGL